MSDPNVMMGKPDRCRVPITVDHVGFEIPDKCVVGHGLDFAEGYRNLPLVGVLKEHPCKEVLPNWSPGPGRPWQRAIFP